MLDDIRSYYILKRIFNNLKKRRTLRLLRNSKNLQNKLNITKKDFLEFVALKKLNKKYHIKIKDFDIEQLNLIGGSFPNDILEDICKNNFKELKKLDLSENIISDIKELKKAKFEKLESLNFMDNAIYNIDILEKVNFKKLKYLDLSGNEISNIKILEKVNFPNLEILYLSKNKISNINVFEN